MFIQKMSNNFKCRLLLSTIAVIGFFSLYANTYIRGCTYLQTTTDSASIENEYVTVTKNNTITANTSVYSYRVIIALTNTIIKSSKGNVSLIRGKTAVFSLKDTFRITEGEYFEVAIKKNHPIPVAPAIWYEPANNNTVLENDEFRIFEEILPPGGVRILHSHLQRVVIRLNNVRLTDPRFHPEGQEGKGIQVPNTAKFAEPVEHVVKNLGSISLFNIVLEFKAPKVSGK